MNEKENLLSVLTGASAGSRRKVAAAIMEGRVTVNGKVAENLRQPVNSRKDRISVDGMEIILVKEKHVYLVLNKPPDVLSTVSDDRGRKTVIDFIPEKYRHLRLYPAGRLDKDSIGLLLLTNDGELTNRLTHPRFKLEKEYLAVIDRELTAEDIKKMEAGIDLYDGKTAPAKVKQVTIAHDFGYSIVIYEGRKRQVRRMLMSFSCHVLRLKRIRIGKLTMGNLKEGEVREIPATEIRKLFNIK
jgi:23S rRNA pseudouridine2605 synthase